MLMSIAPFAFGGLDVDQTLPSLVIIALISIAFLAFVFELFSRGIGLASLVGLVAVSVFFYYQVTDGIATKAAITFFIVGMILVAAELLLPGGIAGTTGFVSVVAGFVLAIGELQLAFTAMTIAVLLSVILFIVMTSVFDRKILFYKPFVLQDATTTEEGYVANVNRVELIGKTGTCLTGLRPAGTIIIDGERIDAVSEGGFVEPNEAVTVVMVEGTRIVVRPTE